MRIFRALAPILLFAACEGQRTPQLVKQYLKDVYTIERWYIENVPIFRDFTSRKKEARLRRHLIGDHRRVIKGIAERYGVQPYRNTGQITADVKAGKLVSIDGDTDQLYYFHNVKKDYRYLVPLAKKGLQLLAKRFNENLQKRKKGLPPVKLAVSSVIRPVDYQKELFDRAFVSTHSFGTTFDIFFEDFMVSLPLPKDLKKGEKEVMKKMRRRFGFLLGDALRRQFHAVLMQTLLELQEEKKLYAIIELNNRCYHVTILESVET